MIENKKTRSHRYKEPKVIPTEPKIDNNEEDKKSPITKILLIIVIIFIILFSYISLVGTSLIEIKEYKVEHNLLPKSFHGLKIVHLSDIHYGTKINKKQLDKIVNKINNLKPDIIIFTGDLIDKNISTTDEIKEEIISSLSNLNCTLYKYAIYGNEDYNNKEYKDIISSINFILLDNESKLLFYKDNTPIEIIGFSPNDSNPNYSIINNSIDELDSKNLYKIILIHEPDNIDNLIEYNPNLILSGHSLGGLIKLPFLKPLFLEEGSTKYYEEYYNINEIPIYISNGLGTSGINARFNNRPSINLYRLYKKDSK